MIILLGTNLLDTDSNHQIANQLETTAQIVQSRYRHLQIHIGTLLPRIHANQIQLNAKIPIVNKLIKKAAKRNNFHICDLNQALTKGGKPKAGNNWNSGGLHLTQIGNLKCKHFLTNYIQNHCKA